MNWPEIIAYTLIGLGLLAGAFLFARRPEFWIEFGIRIGQRLWPVLLKYVTKRMSQEEEAAMQKCFRSGGTWDPVRKKCKDR